MANFDQGAGPTGPQQLPNVPPDLSARTGQARSLINAIEPAIEELKGDIRELRTHRHTDFLFIIGMFATGFVILGGMILYAHLRTDDKITTLTNSTIRTETKLDDLLQRIPPVPTLAPKR